MQPSMIKPGSKADKILTVIQAITLVAAAVTMGFIAYLYIKAMMHFDTFSLYYKVLLIVVPIIYVLIVGTIAFVQFKESSWFESEIDKEMLRKYYKVDDSPLGQINKQFRDKYYSQYDDVE